MVGEGVKREIEQNSLYPLFFLAGFPKRLFCIKSGFTRSEEIGEINYQNIILVITANMII